MIVVQLIPPVKKTDTDIKTFNTMLRIKIPETNEGRITEDGFDRIIRLLAISPTRKDSPIIRPNNKTTARIIPIEDDGSGIAACKGNVIIELIFISTWKCGDYRVMLNVLLLKESLLSGRNDMLWLRHLPSIMMSSIPYEKDLSINLRWETKASMGSLAL